jgi:hypothetical protein
MLESWFQRALRWDTNPVRLHANAKCVRLQRRIGSEEGESPACDDSSGSGGGGDGNDEMGKTPFAMQNMGMLVFVNEGKKREPEASRWCDGGRLLSFRETVQCREVEGET